MGSVAVAGRSRGTLTNLRPSPPIIRPMAHGRRRRIGGGIGQSLRGAGKQDSLWAEEEEQEEEDNQSHFHFPRGGHTERGGVAVVAAAALSPLLLGGVYLSSLIPRDTAAAAAVVTLCPPWLPPSGRRSVCWPAAWHLAAAAKAAGVHPTSVPLCLGGPDPQGGRERGRGRGRQWACEIARKAPRANFCIPLHSARERPTERGGRWTTTSSWFEGLERRGEWREGG